MWLEESGDYWLYKRGQVVVRDEIGGIVLCIAPSMNNVRFC